MKYIQYIGALLFALLFSFNKGYGQDTLRVMEYNVLHYGDGCQGPDSFLHSNLKTIIHYTNPDLLGLVKVQAIKLNSSDNNGISPVGFADSIIKYALNPATYTGKYAYCTLTDVAGAANNDMDVLFYNHDKLGFVSVTNLCSYEEDFDLYKLYYKDPNLSTTHDTTFIYVILNHTDSGTSTVNRDKQDSTVAKALKVIFYHLPNLINMGDFNTHNSSEAGYELYTTTTDTGFLFDDPPFHPDNKLSYPLNWQKNALCSAYLNTTTRLSTIPNSCGTTGGAKDWYNHILLSKWITDSIDYVSYIKNSYQTIFNDGRRLGLSINDSTNVAKNTSAPSNVINALFQLSDKYPLMVQLKVTYNTTGTGPVNPVNGIPNVYAQKEDIWVNNPADNYLVIHFPASMLGKTVMLNEYDICGRLLFSRQCNVNSSEISIENNLTAGVYILQIQQDAHVSCLKIIKK